MIVASERMDEDSGWRELGSGQLLHVDGNLGVTVTGALERPPTRQMTLTDLGAKAAASQAPVRQP
jgi:glutamine amidotransferase